MCSHGGADSSLCSDTGLLALSGICKFVNSIVVSLMEIREKFLVKRKLGLKGQRLNIARGTLRVILWGEVRFAIHPLLSALQVLVPLREGHSGFKYPQSGTVWSSVMSNIVNSLTINFQVADSVHPGGRWQIGFDKKLYQFPCWFSNCIARAAWITSSHSLH